jgi:hypothetical protein
VYEEEEEAQIGVVPMARSLMIKDGATTMRWRRHDGKEPVVTRWGGGGGEEQRHSEAWPEWRGEGSGARQKILGRTQRAWGNIYSAQKYQLISFISSGSKLEPLHILLAIISSGYSFEPLLMRILSAAVVVMNHYR